MRLPLSAAAASKTRRKRALAQRLDESVPALDAVLIDSASLHEERDVQRALWRVRTAYAAGDPPWDQPAAVLAAVQLHDRLREVLSVTAVERRIYTLEARRLDDPARAELARRVERAIARALAGSDEPTAGPAICACLRADLARAWDHLSRGLATPQEALATARLAHSLLAYARDDSAARLAALAAPDRLDRAPADLAAGSLAVGTVGVAP